MTSWYSSPAARDWVCLPSRGVRRLALTDADAVIQTPRDIEVGFFTEEEGVRFGTDMLGSAVTASRIPLDHAHKLTDAGGSTVRDELIRIGFDGEAHGRLPVPHSFIECHIEQGPILADAGVDIGIVAGVQSISWQRLTIRGEAAHAGTTPIASRYDAGPVAASVLGLPYVRAISGAGHDAQAISAICPTAMVFVAGENGGISHTPGEYSGPGGCANGTDLLANAVLRLADQP